MPDRLLRSSRPSGLAARSMLVAVMLAVLVLLGGQLWLSYRDQLRTAEIGTHNLASIFEARFDATLHRIDADLVALSEDIPDRVLRPNSVVRYRQKMNATLDRFMLNREEMAGYRILDAQGNLLYFSGRLSLHRMNVADRSYFQQLRDDPDAGLVISEVMTGRGVQKEMVVVARGLRDARGHFLGAVYGMIDLAYYRRQFESLDLGMHGLVALRRANHALVVRLPDQPGQLNKSLAPSHPVVHRMMSGERAMSLHYEAAPDHVPRILSIVRMRDFPFYFAVGLGRDEVLDVWYQQVVVVVVSATLLFVLVAVLWARLERAQVRRQRMLGELAASEAQFRELTQLVPVGIAYFDRAGRCTYVNDRAAAIAGRNRSDMVGSAWREFIHPEDASRLPERQVVREGGRRAYTHEFRFVRPDGQRSHVFAEIQAGVAADGGVRGYLAALTDITERKQTEAELLEAKQRAESADLGKTRFLAAASHDLRQPIQAINLFLDALRRTDLSPEQVTIADFLSRSGHVLSGLLYSLLDLSKLDAGQIQPHPRPIELEALFQAIDAEFSSLARQKGLRFKLYFPFERRIVVTDPGLLMSIVRNLVDNALKYTEHGGILVGARTRGGRMAIQVWDTGLGVDPRDGDRIFEESFQARDGELDRSKGLGLGLTIARRMARLLDCDLSYDSRLGKGSVFQVLLPDTATSDAADGLVATPIRPDLTAAAVSDVSWLAGKEVVVVEDDPMVSKAIELSLQEMGARVRAYDSAESALVCPTILSADFFVSDFNLPGMDGLCFLKVMAERNQHAVRAVLVTGEALPKRQELETMSPWPILFKPVEIGQLLAAMQAVSDAPSSVEGVGSRQSS